MAVPHLAPDRLDGQAPLALRVCAAYGLPPGDLAGPPATPPALDAESVRLASRHKVQGLLWTALAEGAVTADEEVTTMARDAVVAALRTCLLSEQNAVTTIAVLRAAGIDARALKGVAMAHLDHRDPAERVFGDADVLIRRADHGAALAALTAAGFRRARPPVRRSWERRFAKAVVLYAPAGGEIDLHLTIAGGYFGERIDEAALWAAPSEPVTLVGVEIRGLDPESRLLHACCHAVLGGGSGLRVRRDVAQLALVTRADWRAVVERARRDGMEHVVAAAVRTTWAELDLCATHELAVWAAGLAPDPAQQRALASYRTTPGRGWGSEARGTLPALGAVDRVRFLAGLALPSRASRRARGRTWLRHASIGVGVLSRRR